jgi:outer membrane protein assembly factor BamD
MFRPLFAFLGLAVAASIFPATADAWFFGLFGNKDKWRMMEPAQQDIEATPLIQKAQTYAAEGRIKKAVKYYNKVWLRYPASKYAPDALYNMGRLNMKREKWKKAYTAYNALIKAYPENPHFDEVIADMFDIGEAYETGHNVHYLWWIPYKDRSKAIATYEGLVSMAPYSDFAPIALTRVAMLHRKMRENSAAADAVDRIINDYPNSMEAANATMLMAQYLSEQVAGPEYDQGATHEAMDYYRDFLTLYPNNPSVKYCEEELVKQREQYARSNYVVGEFFYKYRDDYDSAAVFFNDSITADPESSAAKDSRVYLAKIAKIKEKYPNGDWPRRTDWQFLAFWRRWDPLTAPAPKARRAPAAKKEEPPQAPSAPAPAAAKAS